MAKETIENKLNEVLHFLNSFMDDNGYPPSVREIGKFLNIKSTATVYYYLEKLEERGLIKKGKAKHRALELASRMNRRVREIPVVGKVQAGTPIMAVENIEESFNLPNDLFRGEELFILNVSGESMIEAGIFHCDKIIVKKQSSAKNGDIVVAMIDNEATVKRFYKKSDHYVLHPENSTMTDIIVSDLEILGIVVGLIRVY